MKYSYEKAYKPDQWQDDNVMDFHAVVKLANIIDDLYFPNYEKAPWHVQWISPSGSEVNFWPHKIKAHVAYEKGGVAEGSVEVMELLTRLLEEEPEDLIE